MTTRKDLENERDALALLLKHTTYQVNAGHEWLVIRRDALAASIARIDALLTLTDEDCRYMSDELLPTAPPAWHVVASLVRRTP